MKQENIIGVVEVPYFFYSVCKLYDKIMWIQNLKMNTACPVCGVCDQDPSVESCVSTGRRAAVTSSSIDPA
jgi:hypothetical protein